MHAINRPIIPLILCAAMFVTASLHGTQLTWDADPTTGQPAGRRGRLGHHHQHLVGRRGQRGLEQRHAGQRGLRGGQRPGGGRQ